MSIRLARQIIKATPLPQNVDAVQRIRKGFSRDAKYLLLRAGKPRYLLRLMSQESQPRSRQEFEIQRRLHARGGACPKPLVFGTLPCERTCYAILEYLQGQCAQDALPKMSEKRQFETGVAAGIQLRGLHKIRCPDKSFDWYNWQYHAYRRQLEQAAKLGLTFAGKELTERYVETNLQAMQEVPIRFLHSDFHPGNLVVRGGRFAGIIDFGRFRWGDPIYEFKMLPLLTCFNSIPFARGQVHGYFGSHVPKAAWRRYNLYVTMSMHVSLVWPYQNDPKRLSMWRRRIQMIIDSHDLEHSGPPGWYSGS